MNRIFVHIKLRILRVVTAPKEALLHNSQAQWENGMFTLGCWACCHAMSVKFLAVMKYPRTDSAGSLLMKWFLFRSGAPMSF